MANKTTAAVETTATKPVKHTIESYDIANSQETMTLAVDLARFIKENRLFQNIQGREYVNVEGWQYAGSRLGLVPVVEQLVNIGTEREIKYQAYVALINLRTGQKVGGGFAICSNKEGGKRGYQEFAIASMAQTRAIGKSYRNILAWIIRAAGYEPTPAEEMEYQGNPQPAQVEQHEGEEEVKTATAKQKAEIIKLLNHPTITMDEKNKMLLNINRFDEERATQAIAKLKKTVSDREGKMNVAA